MMHADPSVPGLDHGIQAPLRGKNKRIHFVERETSSVADKYGDLYAAVPGSLTSPWGSSGNYMPDYELLHKLIDVTVQSGKAFDPQTGALAAATNVWVATEIRRAGIEPNRV